MLHLVPKFRTLTRVATSSINIPLLLIKLKRLLPFQALDEFATKLIQNNHYAKEDVATRRDAVSCTFSFCSQKFVRKLREKPTHRPILRSGPNQKRSTHLSFSAVEPPQRFARTGHVPPDSAGRFLPSAAVLQRLGRAQELGQREDENGHRRGLQGATVLLPVQPRNPQFRSLVSSGQEKPHCAMNTPVFVICV